MDFHPVNPSRFRPGDPRAKASPNKFAKGNPGRPQGTRNRVTREVQEMLETTAHKLGGVKRLLAWVKERPENEYAFWTSMYMRLLPVQVAGQGPRGAIELNVTIDADELGKRLEERGLPAVVFGADKPVLELEAQQPQLVAEPEAAEPDVGPRKELSGNADN
jgi:hypothetical protein